MFGCERSTELGRASRLHDSGVKHYENSDFHLAIEPLKKAFEIRKKQLGTNNDQTVSTGQFLLTCLDGNGDDELALEIGTEYLRQIETADSRDGHPYAKIETFVGTVQSNLGLFDGAIASLRHAELI